MITEKSREELIAIGAQHRAANLVQQAGYTLGIAAEEEEEIEEVLEDPALVEDVAAARDNVKASMADRELMEQESREHTKRQNEAVRGVKVWRRKAVARAKRAARRGKDIPQELLLIGSARSVPDLIAQLTIMLALFEAHLADLGGARAQALLEEGKTLLIELGGADAAQEVALLASLPEKVRDFYAAKGLLYLGIKLINDGGHELHADSPKEAAKYNMKILYRRGRRNSGGGGGPSGPV